MFANLDALKRSVQNARDDVKEFSRIGVNSSKTFEEYQEKLLLQHNLPHYGRKK
jgi:hypothetical protein